MRIESRLKDVELPEEATREWHAYQREHEDRQESSHSRLPSAESRKVVDLNELFVSGRYVADDRECATLQPC